MEQLVLFTAECSSFEWSTWCTSCVASSTSRSVRVHALVRWLRHVWFVWGLAGSQRRAAVHTPDDRFPDEHRSANDPFAVAKVFVQLRQAIHYPADEIHVHQ